MVDRFQAEALKTRLGIPLIYGVDSVHGHGNLLGATVFPHNIGLGATRDPDLVRKAAHITAEETRATGPQWTFAPCICAAREDRWGRTYESFSEDAGLVTRMETAIDGFQGRRGQLDDPDRVLATAKHYAGDGDTEYGTPTGDYKVDQGIAVTSRPDFWQHSLRQYVPAVQKHDVGSVMPSFSSVDWTEDGVGNPLKMHAHQELITDVLKGRMGFDGFVISDWEAIHQTRRRRRLGRRRSARPSTRASTCSWSPTRTAARPCRPRTGRRSRRRSPPRSTPARVAESRIDDAVSRILTKKFELGLFEQPVHPARNLDEIGSRAHRAVARRAVAKSQVLLKNKQRVLPLSRRSEASTSPARTPTASATRPAAGRSPGRATRRTRSPATRSSTGSEDWPAAR